MKTISIPKNIFEQTFFQRGGQKEVHKALTGEYAFGLEDEDKANAELESGEFFKDSQGIKQVEGEKHSQGGEKLALEDGTKILSDFLKLGGKGAKYINDKYDLGLKASDTYATVLDKYNKKSGLNKINEELEEYIAKLDKQQKETKDENTLALNTEYLTSELNEEFEKKKPLEKIRETIFEDVFNLQESTKKQEEDKTNFQTGGTMTYNGDPVIEIGKKYGLSPERALELYKKGGELPMYQNAGTFDVTQDTRGNIYSPLNPNNPLFFGENFQPILNNRVANKYEKDKYGYQKPNRNWKDFGELNKNEQADVLKDIGRVFPTLASKFLKDGVPNSPKDFQNAINEHYEGLKEDAKKMYPPNSPELKSFLDNVDKEKFTIPSTVKDIKSLVTDTDNKFGDFTSTRPNFAFDILPKDVLTEVKNSGVNTASQLKEIFPEYYNKYVAPKGLTSDFWLDYSQITPQTQLGQQPVSTTSQQVDKIKPVNEIKNRGMLLLPDQTPMTPSSQMAHLKPQRRFERIDPVFISPERQLAEIDRGINSAQANLAMLPDAQAAAAFSSLNANNTESMNKVLSEVNRYNAQAKESANRTNAQIGQAEENAAWQDALNYERNTYLAKANTEQSWRNFYDTLASNQMNDWKHIEMLNQSNALNPEVQYTNEGYKVFKPEFSNNPELIRALNAANVNTENIPTRKAKAKKGGRFKKC